MNRTIYLIAMLFALLTTSCGSSSEEIYQEGKTHLKNKEYDKALECFTKAKEQGYDSAYSALAGLYYNGFGVEKNYEKAFEYAQTANQKNAGGNYYLGLMYYFGNGVERNYSKSLEYLKKVETSASNAAYLIGLMYYNGNGVTQNYATAFEYFQKANEKGVPGGTYYLGRMYYHGKGVEKNYTKAFDYFKKADEKGIPEGS